MKCPYCNDNDMIAITETSSEKYYLTKFDISNNKSNLTDGMPVDAYVCPKCKSIHLKASKI